MKIRTQLFAALALVATASLATAYISSKAPGASHDLEETAAELHHYMHHGAGFPSSYGSHDMEEAAGELHHVLHEWNEGELTECDVIGARGDAGNALVDMTGQFLENGVFADSGATGLYFETVGDYFKVFWYTLFAKC